MYLPYSVDSEKTMSPGLSLWDRRTQFTAVVTFGTNTRSVGAQSKQNVNMICVQPSEKKPPRKKQI